MAGNTIRNTQALNPVKVTVAPPVKTVQSVQPSQVQANARKATGSK
ncbi:hypothetical protein QNH39_18860 [Neobacillus novalis]|uniref:Uncharacterized protein n=1 Tax=Neobacillus novalis TaxID=220687 RepID=A0AA95MJ02_9BACI|nr:hypothetical protein [Neobacillus novalis]WHY84697.1 hypothetical protein QNH39_18860 [Neobacillus novalis]